MMVGDLQVEVGVEAEAEVEAEEAEAGVVVAAEVAAEEEAVEEDGSSEKIGKVGYREIKISLGFTGKQSGTRKAKLTSDS